MTAQDMINVLNILKAAESVSFSRIQRKLEMSVSKLESILSGLCTMGIVYKPDDFDYRLTEKIPDPFLGEKVRQAFEDIISNRGAYLTAELLSKVSTPFIPMMTEEYKQAPRKVMIVGQETLGMEEAFDSIGSAQAYFEERTAFFKEFSFGKELNNSHFWFAFDQVVSHFSLEGRNHAYWTNLNKFQLISKKSGSNSPSKLNAVDIMSLIKMQRALFLAEIEDAKPDVIVYFTGAQTWMLDHYLNGGKKLAVKPLDKRSHLGIIETDILHCPIAVCTDHPASWKHTEATLQHRKNALNYALNKLEGL